MALAQLILAGSQLGGGWGRELQGNQSPVVAGIGGGMENAFDPITSARTSQARGDSAGMTLAANALPILGSAILSARSSRGKGDTMAETSSAQQAFLQQLAEKRARIAAGTDRIYQNAIGQAQLAQASTQSNIAKRAGDIGSFLTGINQAARATGDTIAQATGYLTKEREAAETAYGQQMNLNEQRKFAAMDWAKLQAIRQREEAKQGAGQNTMGALAAIYGMINSRTGDGGQPVTTNTFNTPISNMNTTPQMGTASTPNYWGNTTTSDYLSNIPYQPQTYNTATY